MWTLPAAWASGGDSRGCAWWERKRNMTLPADPHRRSLPGSTGPSLEPPAWGWALDVCLFRTSWELWSTAPFNVVFLNCAVLMLGDLRSVF